MDGADQYEQEFGIENDGIASLPRITCGYDNGDENMWTALDGISGLGILSHFIHPDDILDNARSGGISWEEMYRRYNSFISTLYNKYDWMRPVTATEATSEMKKYLSTDVYYEKTVDGITGYCNGINGSMFFILRSEKKVSAKSNCTVRKIDDNLYLVKTSDTTFKINIE